MIIEILNIQEHDIMEICYAILLLQWLPLESLQVLFYEAKVPFSERCITIQKCEHAVKLLGHSCHTLALSKEVWNFILSQGSQKLLAKVKM